MHKPAKRRMVIKGLTAAVFAAAGLMALRQPAEAQFVSGLARPPAARAGSEAATTQPVAPVISGPRDPAWPPFPGAMMDRAADTGMQVKIDDSFSSVADVWGAIQFQIRGQPREAITAYQKIIDKYGQKLILLEDGSFVSTTDYAIRWLLLMPAVKNGMYDQLYGMEAKKAIDAAIDDRDLSTLIRACDRYFPSSAALKGLSQAADWYFERGDFSAAAETWRKLMAHPQAGHEQADYVFRAAVAQSLAGNKAAAAKLREQLAKDFPDASGKVAGKDVKLLSKLDEIAAMPSWDRTQISGDEWPAFGGGADREGIMNTTAAIGARLWSVDISGGSPPAPAAATSETLARQLALQRARIGGEVFEPGAGSDMLTSHPVLSHGTLFIHLGTGLMALSATAGTPLWTYPAPSDGPNTRRPANQARSSMAHDSVAVSGDQVFAVMPTGNGIASANALGQVSYPTQLVCLNRDDGTVRWTVASSTIKTETENGALVFTGSPIVSRQGVYVMARKNADQNFSQLYLVRLDRDTGQPTWTCYLCSTTGGLGYYINSMGEVAMNTSIPVPTLVDDVLYVSTGQGADCAVDANVGRILWLRVSKRAPANVTWLPSWKFNAPLVVGDDLFAADAGGDLRVYNRWSGKLIQQLDASTLLGDQSPVRGSSLDVIESVGNKLLMCIGNVSLCFDAAELEKAAPQHLWAEAVAANDSDGSNIAAGRPFLAADWFYVPFSSKLVRISLKTGKQDPIKWPKNEKGDDGRPGNLLVTSEQVVVVNDTEVAGYSRWETARDNWQAKIDAAPKDPAMYLGLAEVSFRTSHHELAQKNMKQAVELANGGQAGSAKSTADILDRLYRTNFAFAEQLVAKADNESRELSRFYYEQCRATARQPEQQAEWRLRLADLAKAQRKPAEAVDLYSEVLADSAIRVANYRDAGGLQSAGALAEIQIKNLMHDNGAEIYQRYENDAAAREQQASKAQDTSALQQVIDAFPNARASVTAATSLAAIYLDKQMWEQARGVLFWLEPRVTGDAQAKAIVNLVSARVGLKQYQSAREWAARGLRLYKDYTWTDAGKKMSFTDLQSKVALLGGEDVEGRLPRWTGTTSPAGMIEEPISDEHRISKHGQLLVPVEKDMAMRPPNFVFVREDAKLRIYDTDKKAMVADDIGLGLNADAVCMGVSKGVAVFMQRDAVYGVDLKTHDVWHVLLPARGPARPVAAVPNGALRPGVIRSIGTTQINGVISRQIMVSAGTEVDIVNGNVTINGNNYGPAETTTVVDELGNIITGRTGSDPDMARRNALAVLGNQMRFNTARLLNGNLLVLAGNQIDAYDVTTGKPAWADASGKPASITVQGDAISVMGNEDIVVVQADDSASKTANFYAFDAQKGTLKKTLKLQNERPRWWTIGDDGTLFVIADAAAGGDSAISAYDLMAPMENRVVWRKTGIGSRYANAAALTLDGLIVVSDEGEVQCLPVDTGDTPRWRHELNGELMRDSSAQATLRSIVDGDVVIFQSKSGVHAFQTQVMETPKTRPGEMPPDPQVAWAAADMESSPPRLSLQMFDQYYIELFAGPSPTTGTAKDVTFKGSSRHGGKLCFVENVISNPLDGSGPAIRSWQTADGGIAMDTGAGGNGNNIQGPVFFWPAKQE